jgi:hypothetical protein
MRWVGFNGRINSTSVRGPFFILPQQNMSFGKSKRGVVEPVPAELKKLKSIWAWF